MFQIERHKTIYNYLLDHKNATVNELSKLCKVSPITIRRDLDKMESEGFITRVFGGAVVDSNIVPEVTYEEKEKICIKQKEAIAKEAANLVSDNVIVILDSGTTCMEIAKQLVHKENLKVITTDILIAAYLMNYKNIEVYCSGGRVQSQVGCCVDNTSVDFFNSINADVCFVGAGAINKEFSLSTFTSEKVKIKQAMMNAAEYKVLVSDDSKFNKKSFCKICDLADFNLVIVNDNIDKKLKNNLEESGVTLKLV